MPNRSILPTAIAATALFVALGGPAVAAKGLIGARDIATGGVTGKAIKNGTIGSKDLNKNAKLALRGARGAAGANGMNGPNGPNGANGADGTNGRNGTDGANGADGANGGDGANGADGADGADGILGPFSNTGGSIALATGAPLAPVVSLAVPAANYVVFAKTQLSHTGAGDSVNCVLRADGTTIDQVAMKTLPALAAIPVSMEAVTTTSPTQLSIACNVAVANGAADFSRLIAIPAN